MKPEIRVMDVGMGLGLGAFALHECAKSLKK